MAACWNLRTRQGRHAARHTHTYTQLASLVEDQVAELLDKIHLDEADIGAILRAVRRVQPAQAEPDTAERIEARGELQRRLERGVVSLETFSREWRRLDRPIAIPVGPTQDELIRARAYLQQIGQLWKDPDVPAELRQEAAQVIFERLDVLGPRLVAAYPREEHAWLLGMHAKKQGLLGMVGARGVEPPPPTLASVQERSIAPLSAPIDGSSEPAESRDPRLKVQGAYGPGSSAGFRPEPTPMDADRFS
jgi:hypothetical protein